jgi:hypothetical protein
MYQMSLKMTIKCQNYCQEVDIILSNNGYEVINMGIKQSVEAIIQAYETHKPDCIQPVRRFEEGKRN